MPRRPNLPAFARTARSLRRKAAAILLVVPLLVCASPAAAQPADGGLIVLRSQAASSQPADCSDGVRLDDGSFEGGIYAGPLPTKIVTRFAVAEPSILDRVCVCWRRGGLVDGHSFDVVVYDDDGPGGEPGTLLARESVEVNDVPTGPGSFYGFDLSGLDVSLPPGAAYVGVDAISIFESGLLLCTDTNGPGNAPILFAPGGSSSNWADVRSQLPDLRALGVRVKLDAESGPGPGPGPGPGADSCTPSDTVLCVDDAPGDRRFRVELEYSNQQANGSAHAVPLADLGVTRGGLFWIGNRNNPEMLIKILNACAAFDHYWVFYAATTDQGLVTTVTDTRTGRVWQRTNPLGAAAAPVQDTRAFPCP